MKKNSGIILIGAAAAAYFLLGSKKSSAKEKAPELKVGDVVDAGIDNSYDPNTSYEWRVVVDSLTPGFGSGAMYRGEWRIAGTSQYTVASSASGASSFSDPNDAKNTARYALGLHDENQYG